MVPETTTKNVAAQAFYHGNIFLVSSHKSLAHPVQKVLVLATRGVVSVNQIHQDDIRIEPIVIEQ